MLKILIIVTKGEVGGAQMSVFNLAKGLSKNNVDVIVGFGEGDFLQKKLEKENIRFVNFKWLKRTANPLSNFFFILEIKKFLNNKKLDVVHFNSSNSLFGALGAKLSNNKPKTIFTFRGLSMLHPNYEANALLKLAYFLFFKFFLNFVDEKVFVCESDLKTARGSGIAREDGRVIYNGIEPESLNFLNADKAREFIGNKCNQNLQGKYILGSVGRLAYPKNYEFLISNFPEIIKIKENAVAVIIGDGPEKEKYLKLIKESGLSDKVFLVGNIDNASSYIKAFDLFVLPSVFEGLSITLIEALFAGLPILASDVGGNSELLKDCGMTYKLNDVKEFISAIKNIILKTGVSEEMKKGAIKKSGSFNIKHTIDGYVSIYQ